MNILFDTEQSRYDVLKVNKRIIDMCGLKEQPDNFQSYSLRQYTPEERLLIIDYILKETKNIGYVIIDGIRDLINDINNIDQSIDITTKLMQWTDQYNCHISVGLHLNKGQNAELRGHLGSEIQNKAESIIEIEKDPDNDKWNIIKARDFRRIQFDSIGMTIDENYFPVIDQDYVEKNNKNF